MRLRPDKVQTLLPKAPIKDQQEMNPEPAQQQISSPDLESLCQAPRGLFLAGGADGQDKLLSAAFESHPQVTSQHPAELC